MAPELIRSIDDWASHNTDGSRSEAIRRLVELGLAGSQPMRGEAQKPQRRPPIWQASKSTNSVIHQQPTKNGNSGNGGSSKGRKSSGICVTIFRSRRVDRALRL
jgi:hypothetical protein